MQQVSAWGFVWSFALSASALAAAPLHVGAYAVANHSSCGNMNLPATITELNKFFASPNFPRDNAKNFLWTDSKVKGGDWLAAHDNFTSTGTANGFDGSDSSLIAYIASHGGTSGDRYSMSVGGADGKCTVSNTEMAMGDNKAKYMILSTCQGLKNPRTWQRGNAGLNCILGYANNMEDSDVYGEQLLANLAPRTKTLVTAFFEASRTASYDNIPAVLCFGPNDMEAKKHLDEDKWFSESGFGAGGTAYVADQGHRVPGAFAASLKTATLGVPRTLQLVVLAPVSIRGATQVTSGLGDEPLAMSDATAVGKAMEALLGYQLVGATDEVQPSFVIDRTVTTGDVTEVVAKTVVLHQRLGGLSMLGREGVFEVTLTAGDQVSIEGRPVAVGAVGKELAPIADHEVAAAVAAARVLLAARYPAATLAHEHTSLGYKRVGGTAQVVAAISFLVSQGGFGRIVSTSIAL